MYSSRRTFRKVTVWGLAISLMLVLTACDGSNDASTGTAAPPEAAKNDPEHTPKNDESAEEYKKEVKAQMRRSLRNGLIRDYGISEEQANCLVENLSVGQLKTAQSDLEAQAEIETCGVDPAIIK
jgi:hypothetical protein